MASARSLKYTTYEGCEWLAVFSGSAFVIRGRDFSPFDFQLESPWFLVAEYEADAMRYGLALLAPRFAPDYCTTWGPPLDTPP